MDANGHVSPQDFELLRQSVVEMQELGLPWDPSMAAQHAKAQSDAVLARLEKQVLGGLKGRALLTRLGPVMLREISAALREARSFAGAPPVSGGGPVAAVKSSDYMTVQEMDAAARALRAKL